MGSIGWLVGMVWCCVVCFTEYSSGLQAASDEGVRSTFPQPESACSGLGQLLFFIFLIYLTPLEPYSSALVGMHAVPLPLSI
jgi:hypothetical protein